MEVFRKNDAWWIDYYHEDRRHRQKIGSRKKDAEEALSRIKVKIDTGEFTGPAGRPSADEQRVPRFDAFATDEPRYHGIISGLIGGIPRDVILTTPSVNTWIRRMVSGRLSLDEPLARPDTGGRMRP